MSSGGTILHKNEKDAFGAGDGSPGNFLMNLSMPFRIQKLVHELTNNFFFFLEPHIRAEQIVMINSPTWETCPERQAASLDPSHPCLPRSLQNPGTKLRRGCCFLFI